jgi:hypothetical protein
MMITTPPDVKGTLTAVQLPANFISVFILSFCGTTRARIKQKQRRNLLFDAVGGTSTSVPEYASAFFKKNLFTLFTD